MTEPMSLSVDMVRCTGHGICAWLFPQRVELDEWGFAQVDPAPLTERSEMRAARRAERACPKRALLLRASPVSPATRPTV